MFNSIRIMVHVFLIKNMLFIHPTFEFCIREIMYTLDTCGNLILGRVLLFKELKL